jgi:hypothetical protein
MLITGGNMERVRFKTWYWGKYCLATNSEAKNLPKNFELYNEELHGWHNSEEYKTGLPEYESEIKGIKLKEVINGKI